MEPPIAHQSSLTKYPSRDCRRLRLSLLTLRTLQITTRILLYSKKHCQDVMAAGYW